MSPGGSSNGSYSTGCWQMQDSKQPVAAMPVFCMQQLPAVIEASYMPFECISLVSRWCQACRARRRPDAKAAQPSNRMIDYESMPADFMHGLMHFAWSAMQA